MPTFIYSVLINATPEKVFAHITDFSNHGSWYEYPWRVESRSPGAMGVGSQFRSIADDSFGKQIPDEISVTKYQSPTRFCFVCKDPRYPFPTVHEFTIRAQDSATLLERQFISKPGFPFNMLNPLVSVIEPFLGRTAMLRSMNKIKANMEGKKSGLPHPP